MRLRLILPLVTLLAGSAAAVELSGRARGWGGAGIDTNPRRDYVSPGTSTPVDGGAQGIANLSGALSGQRGELSGAYDVAGRKFFLLGSEDTIIQSAMLDGTLWLPRGFSLSVTGRERDRRSAERDYSDFSAEGSIGFAP